MAEKDEHQTNTGQDVVDGDEIVTTKTQVYIAKKQKEESKFCFFQNIKFIKSLKNSPKKKIEQFENLRVTVSPGKARRQVCSVEQEEKKVAGEVLLGKFLLADFVNRDQKKNG